MEVILILLGAFLLAFSTYQYNKSSNLQREVDSLGNLLTETLKDSERQLEDHKLSEMELSITKAKLEGLGQSTLTPDNSIPKDIHIEKVIELSNKLSSTEAMLQDTTEKFEDLRGKQISERVRLGHIGENFAAFHDKFPYNRKQVKALFQPVDLIYFGDDEVVFIDVKTGDAQLNKRQRMIRDSIRAGKVRFEVHRLDGSGYHIKEAK